jgi:hypothetical protein
VAPAQQVFFGSAYSVRMDYTGAQTITVSDKPSVTDHLVVHVKGPKVRFQFRDLLRARRGAHAAPHPDPACAWGLSRWSWCAEMRVAFFSPLPPARSGIADYSEALIQSLKPLVDLEVFSEAEPGVRSGAVRHRALPPGQQRLSRLRLRDGAAAPGRGGDA